MNKNGTRNGCCSYENKTDNCFDLGQKKENTLCSLYEVESFLCNCSKALKCLNLYWFLK